MKSTRARFVCVALLVCLFAIGMATFLNYFKYKSTAGQIVKSRVLVVANAIENSVQASLSLGLSFSELGMLSSLLERQKASDNLIVGIDVFDTAGKLLYSTDNSRVGQPVPDPWAAAAKAIDKKNEWFVEESGQLVTGIALKNNFDLTVGYLALRYSRAYVDAATSRVGQKLLMTALPVLGVIALLAPFAFLLVMRSFDRDMRAVSESLEGQGSVPAKGPFVDAVTELKATLHDADTALEAAQRKLATLT